MERKEICILLDPAHGIDVAGKKSPDRKHKEYKWSREICKLLEYELRTKGYRVEWTTKSETEPGLSVRKKMASSIKSEDLKFLISPHNNAAGAGTEWMSARGVEIYTTPGFTKSDIFADIVLKQLMKDFPDYKYRTDISDKDLDKEANFTVLTGAGYSAVLLEWLFQDNKEDVELLMNPHVNQALVASLVKAIDTINKYVSDNK